MSRPACICGSDRLFTLQYVVLTIGSHIQISPRVVACMPVDSLFDICLNQLVTNIDRVASLEGLPEEIVSQLWCQVLARGLLKPKTLALFTSTQHYKLLGTIRVRDTFFADHTAQAEVESSRCSLARVLTQELNLREPPPLFDDTPNPWLGERRL